MLSRGSLPGVDALNALGTLIVWLHLAFYGPMSDVVHGAAPTLMDWLYNYARMARRVRAMRCTPGCRAEFLRGRAHPFLPQKRRALVCAARSFSHKTTVTNCNHVLFDHETCAQTHTSLCLRSVAGAICHKLYFIDLFKRIYM